MSQKINPTSLRLGKIQIWNIVLQNYGKTYTFYFKFLYSYLTILYFFQNYFSKSNLLLLGDLKLNFKQNKLEVQAQAFSDVFFNKNYFFLVKEYFRILVNWYPKNFCLRFYTKSKISFSASLVSAYSFQLFKKYTSLKKVINLIFLYLKTQISSKKVIYSKFGATELVLKGFKICLSGRLDNSKNQMAKKLEYLYGTLPLINMENHIEYSNFLIFSKLGTCNFQIWLFFKINKKDERKKNS